MVTSNEEIEILTWWRRSQLETTRKSKSTCLMENSKIIIYFSTLSDIFHLVISFYYLTDSNCMQMKNFLYIYFVCLSLSRSFGWKRRFLLYFSVCIVLHNVMSPYPNHPIWVSLRELHQIIVKSYGIQKKSLNLSTSAVNSMLFVLLLLLFVGWCDCND